jgi:hypothetical protein
MLFEPVLIDPPGLVIDHVNDNNTGDQDLSNLVPKTTTVNGHSLSSDVLITKSDISLGNVDNTSDINKPISTATQTALDLKASDTLVVHLSGSETLTGSKTINNTTGGDFPALKLINTAVTTSPVFSANGPTSTNLNTGKAFSVGFVIYVQSGIFESSCDRSARY